MFSISYSQVDKNSNILNQIQFENNYNTYKWEYGFQYNKALNNKDSLVIKENYKTSLLRIGEDQKKWKDDQHLDIDYYRQIAPGYIGRVISSSLMFSDRISGVKNNIETNFGSIGIESQPISTFKVTSFFGYKFDSRFDQRDEGITYLFNLNIPRIEIEEYKNKFRLYLNGDDFSVRKNNDFVFNYQVNREFYSDTFDSLSVTWTKTRKDNYDRFQKDVTFIESLRDNIFVIKNTLNYRISGLLTSRLFSSVSTKETDISRLNTKDHRSRTDFNSVNEFELNLNTKKIQSFLKFAYITEDEKNEVPDSLKSSRFSYRFGYISPDYKSTKFSIVNKLNYNISNRDTLGTNIDVSIFRYDTPEESNYDDRDEFLMNYNFFLIHKFSSSLKLKVNTSVNLKHLVFIFNQRSADNNWMRVVRLNPEIVYKIKPLFSWFQSYEVLANYVDYDFEEQTLNRTDIRSFVYRKFSMYHIFSYYLNRRTSIDLNYRLELEENGKLFWDEWSEMVISTKENHFTKAQINYRIFSDAVLSVGLIFFDRSEKFHLLELNNTENRFNSDYTSYGPTISFKYAPHSKLSLIFSGSRRVIDPVDRKRSYINNINLNLSCYF